MRITDAREEFAELEFPMRVEKLIEETGDQTLEAPVGTPESIGEALQRTDETTVHSAAEAYTLLVSVVSDAYIGRKYYDDRSPNPHRFDRVSL